jgi:hypothetical protein
MKHPYRARLDFTVAAPRTEDVQPLYDALTAVLEQHGANYEGGYIEHMESEDVIEGSPLATALEEHEPERPGPPPELDATPFDHPDVHDGYPLSDEERRATDDAARRSG